jgi:CCR4-NOT transcriptional regulation complex NOT5 subunit
VQQAPQFKSIKAMQAHRSQMKTDMSADDVELQEHLKQKHARSEEDRLERLHSRDQLVSEQHARIQQQLLR